MTSPALLEEILSDPKITDILIDGHHKVLVEKDGELLEITHPFLNEQELQQWTREIINGNGSRLDIAKPISEVTVETTVGLIRIHAVLAGECSKRTQVSIRRHAVSSLTMADLLRVGSLSKSHIETIRQILSLRENFVIIGGTGSGKTTLLKSMLNEVANERVITIEDAPELGLGGNSVSLVTRAANHEGVGEISLARLLREALRMRPDRLVIGEARGEELLILLQAMNTGHAGSGFTLHANSIRDVIPRMLAILSGIGVSTELAKVLITSSVSWVIELSRSNSRREVANIQRMTELVF
jgi:pilus assembly protein CpaF